MSRKPNRVTGWSRESKPGDRNPNYRHGHSTNGTTREYRAWYSMKRRCLNPSNEKFSHYGGRGISFHPPWADFRAFLADMGPAPSPTHTLERRDVDKDYGPDNCVWATWVAQANNKQTTIYAEIGGVTRSVKQWSAVYGLPASAIHKRLRRGWPLIEAITTSLKSVTDQRRRK